MQLARFVAEPEPLAATLTANPGEASGLRYKLPEQGYSVREVRGGKMRTVAGVFDEFAAAFQFPYYFGENKDAFDDCLRDLPELVGTANGYVVVVRDADQLLANEPDELPWLISALRGAARYGVSVVLLTEPPKKAEVDSKWKSAGIEPVSLEL